MRAIVSGIGKDGVGITAKMATKLAEYNINILDISQTILSGYFTVIMVVDIEKMNVDFQKLAKELDDMGKKIGISIHIQREEIFDAMNNI